jgi:uncharacterized protein YyaL (SSP411 family)
MAENLRIYSLAYVQWREPQYFHAAQENQRYLRTFLTSPTGAFYTSQDADLVDGKHNADYFALSDAQRRKLGIPRVDKHIYARENGWAINGLVALYAASGDRATLDEAIRATLGACQSLASRKRLPSQLIRCVGALFGRNNRHDARVPHAL